MKVLVTLPSGASARSEFPLDGPEARDIAALKYEDWVIKVGEQAPGDHEMIRVNVSARAGDDLFIGQEVVTFLVLDGTSLARLWTGLNGKLDRRCDSSFLLTDAVDMLPDGRGANLLRMRFGQGKMALKRTIHIPAAPSSAAYPETAFIPTTRAHTLPLGVCSARTTSTSPRSSP